MKVHIIQEGNKVKTCPKCKHNIFRKSTKSKYDEKENKGVTYDLNICDRCNNREEYNHINWWKEK